MRKPIQVVGMVLLGGLLLGATVFRSQVADAAAAILNVKVLNTAAEPVPVRQQGPSDVNVTNGSLTLAAPAPVTSGGQRVQVFAGQDVVPGTALTASAIVLHFRNGATELIFFNDNLIAARFPGPGPIMLSLTQPIQFDELSCSGPGGSSCDLGWAGSAG
jgi:hypothetical protein